jgi:hypothetical protein
MEKRLMAHLGFDPAVISGYERMKSTLISNFGVMAVMRFTGEVFTFIFNTLGNIAFTGLKYIIPPGTPSLYGGDDKSINCALHVRPGWSSIARHYALTEKQITHFEPTFCGWRLSQHGIVKDPRLLFWRTRTMARRYHPSLWAPGYYLELQISLSKGEMLRSLLDEAGLHYLQLLIHIFRHYTTKLPNLQSLAADYPLSDSTQFAPLHTKHKYYGYTHPTPKEYRRSSTKTPPTSFDSSKVAKHAYNFARILPGFSFSL